MNASANMDKNQRLPWWQKYTLTLEEAAQYFGVSYKKLRLFCREHAVPTRILSSGTEIVPF